MNIDLNFQFQSDMEQTLHEIIRYCRYKEETEGIGKQMLDELFLEYPNKAKAFYPLIENTEAEYTLNITS